MLHIVLRNFGHAHSSNIGNGVYINIYIYQIKSNVFTINNVDIINIIQCVKESVKYNKIM